MLFALLVLESTLQHLHSVDGLLQMTLAFEVAWLVAIVTGILLLLTSFLEISVLGILLMPSMVGSLVIVLM
jgi:hypothetical protein